MANHQFSPEYLKRREEILADLGRMSKTAIATHLAHLETEVKNGEAAQRELRKVVSKYQGILGRLSTILTSGTAQYKSGRYYGKEGRELPFNYEIAFRNCRVIIADYYEDIKFCNPAGYTKGSSEQRHRDDAKRKLRRLRA